MTTNPGLWAAAALSVVEMPTAEGMRRAILRSLKKTRMKRQPRRVSGAAEVAPRRAGQVVGKAMRPLGGRSES